MYFDPGTGSMLIQVLLGAIPVIGAFFIGLRNKIFKKKSNNALLEGHADTEEATNNKDMIDDGFEDIDD